MDSIKKVSELLETLKYNFKDESLLETALTHSSWVGEPGRGDVQHNERLEYIGDAVLDLAVGYRLYQKSKAVSEGFLTKKRAFLVQKSFLSSKAEQLELGSYLKLGKGEEMSKGREKDSLLANCFEAVIGAIFVDSDFDTVLAVIDQLYQGDFNLFEPGSISVSSRVGDFKSALQEFTQEHFKSLPEYKLVSKEGPEHEKIFIFEVRVGEQILSQGRGKSKKQAQQQAAQKTLDILKIKIDRITD
jgi:ribonuclease-3